VSVRAAVDRYGLRLILDHEFETARGVGSIDGRRSDRMHQI
jgi:hypothetical protein